MNLTIKTDLAQSCLSKRSIGGSVLQITQSSSRNPGGKTYTITLARQAGGVDHAFGERNKIAGSLVGLGDTMPFQDH